MRSPVVDVEVPKEDTPLVAEGGDIEQGLVEPSQLKPIKDGNTKETLVGVFGAITCKSLHLFVLRKTHP